MLTESPLRPATGTARVDVLPAEGGFPRSPFLVVFVGDFWAGLALDFEEDGEDVTFFSWFESPGAENGRGRCFEGKLEASSQIEEGRVGSLPAMGVVLAGGAAGEL